MTQLFPQAEGQCGAKERQDIRAAQSRKREVCQCKQETTRPTEEQSRFGECCFYETPSDQGREFGACPGYERGHNPGRHLVAYRKHVSREQAQGNLVCAMMLSADVVRVSDRHVNRET